MSRFSAPFLSAWRDPRVRQLLLYCLPALLAGLALRVMLTAQMPYGLVHPDTSDYLTTPVKLLSEHKFQLHMKKTFLGPVFFTVPFLLHVPALLFIPLVQHLLGLVLIAMIGLLCRLWFVHWKWFIIPATLFVAVNPAIIWYEHVLLAEFLYAFCTVLLAVAGTLYVREPSRGRLIFLLAALVLEASARPEGKLLFGFGILLVLLTHWGNWSRAGNVGALVAVVAIATHFITRTSQAGLLLYTSVCYLTPAHVKCAPGFETYIAPVQAQLKEGWVQEYRFAKAHERRLVMEVVDRYFADHPEFKNKLRPHPDQVLCNKLAMETVRRNPVGAAQLAYYKFRYTATLPTNGDFSEDWVYGDQIESLQAKMSQLDALGRGLTGTLLTSDEAISAWVHAHYSADALRWFNDYSERWHSTLLTARLPDIASGKRRIAGVAWFYIFAGLGMALAILRGGPKQKLHLALGLSLCGLLFTIALTANVKPRFRFVFEPFWGLYILLGLDCALSWIRKFRRRDAVPATVQT